MIGGRLSDFVEVIGARPLGTEDVVFTGVATDTRTAAPGELFFALQGPSRDGHDFVPAAAAAGVAAAVVTRQLPDVALPQLLVDDTLRALGALGQTWRRRLAPQVAAVTGSNGKTTVKNMLASIAAQVQPVLATEGNFNNEIGVPLTLARLAPEHRLAVVEVACSHPGDIAYLAGLVEPRVAVVTNAAAAHVAGLGSLQGVAREKGALFEALPDDGCAILNADDPYADYWRGLIGDRRVLSFGTGPRADVRVGGHAVRADGGSTFQLTGAVGTLAVELALGGHHNALNAAAAASAALALGIEAPAIGGGLARVTAAPGRLQRHVLHDGATLIDDSYNANPASMRAAIDFLTALPGRAWLALGTMAELGDASVEAHAALGRYAAQAGVERLFAAGEATDALVQGARDAGLQEAERFEDHAAAADAILARLEGGVNLLVKGSRSAAMERVAQAVLRHPRTDRSDSPC